ncbi:MAG: thiamine pyrophosphate-binding protein [Rhodobiaceae bacterium]|nr:thiamine pyrophosphate-binding protein [Hyphomonas sp.]MCB9971214.1 thiamine pyrophosphate-binding protein [Hyphomonas sp.]MCC0050283.1 thiamine pyrophosphate-binding protein [Rhodobiaceae bacterium]
MAKTDNLLTGGDLLARTLREAGVKRIFALHGGHHEALFKGCHEQGIELMDFRHESAAGHAADAYARTTGDLGVCIITAGPGFTNGVSAIANAKLDGSPVLFIIGAPPLREVETNPLQGGIDQIAMARPMTKWAFSIPTTERIPDLTAMAIRKARAGTKGPVVLELPIDVLHMKVPASRATKAAGVNVAPHPAPSAGEVAALAELVRSAERPAIIAGTEAANVATAEALRRFAAATGIPCFFKSQAMGLLPYDHAQNGGSPGNLAGLMLMGGNRPDLVILLGGKLGLLLGGRSGAIVPDAAKLVQVHSDATEIGRLRSVDLAIAAGTAETLDALGEALEGADPTAFAGWCQEATSLKGAMAAMFPDPNAAKNGVHPYHAAKAVCAVAGRDACYAFDGGEAASWGGDAVQVDGPCQVLGHGYLGCLGIGPGFAIGLQVAHPDRRVVHLTGDGAMGFHIQEFDTMVRHNLPIVTVVFNNGVWGMSIHGQQLMYGANYNIITQIAGTRYADIAAAFGCHAERVDRLEDVGSAMERAFASGKPAMVEIMVDADVVHPVTASMLGQIAEGSSDVMIPYYENIPAEAT